MNAARWLTAALLVVGVALDSFAARPSRPAPPVQRDGYFVLAVDFHVHSFLGDGALAPWLLADEARRQGLDAVAITDHNRTWPARLARWLARPEDATLVLVGEEVTARGFHIVAVGVEQPVDWRHSAGDAIDAIHAQGGIAIAAHPGVKLWPAFDEAALRKLDGAERANASIYPYRGRFVDRQFEIFFSNARRLQPTVAAIGSSDFHVLGHPGFSRTYVFAREPTAQGILEAVRAGHTVVFDRLGRPRGDPTLFPLLPVDGRSAFRALPRPGLGGLCAWLGLLGLLLAGGRRREAGLFRK